MQLQLLVQDTKASFTLTTEVMHGWWVITIYAPMIYTAPCIMFWMCAYPLRGHFQGPIPSHLPK